MVVKVSLFLTDRLAAAVLQKAQENGVSVVKQILNDLSDKYGVPTTATPEVVVVPESPLISWGSCKHHVRKRENSRVVLWCKARNRELSPTLSDCTECPRFEPKQ